MALHPAPACAVARAVSQRPPVPPPEPPLPFAESELPVDPFADEPAGAFAEVFAEVFAGAFAAVLEGPLPPFFQSALFFWIIFAPLLTELELP